MSVYSSLDHDLNLVNIIIYTQPCEHIIHVHVHVNTTATANHCDFLKIISHSFVNNNTYSTCNCLIMYFGTFNVSKGKSIFFLFVHAVAKINMSHVKLIFWDLGGQQELQSLWDKVLFHSKPVLPVTSNILVILLGLH